MDGIRVDRIRVDGIRVDGRQSSGLLGTLVLPHRLCTFLMAIIIILAPTSLGYRVTPISSYGVRKILLFSLARSQKFDVEVQKSIS